MDTAMRCDAMHTQNTKLTPHLVLSLSILSDEIILTLSHRGSIVSMAYIPLVSPLAPSCQQLEKGGAAAAAAGTEFSSKVTLETTRVAMTLPTVLLPTAKPPQGLKVLKRTGGGKNGKTTTTTTTTAFEGDDQEQQMPITNPLGFIKKYWYILVAVIFMSVSGGSPDDEGAKQQRGQAGVGGNGGGQPGEATAVAAAPIAAAAAAAASASTPSPGGAKQRRGKRA
jgi:hypothetical protein